MFRTGDNFTPDGAWARLRAYADLIARFVSPSPAISSQDTVDAELEDVPVVPDGDRIRRVADPEREVGGEIEPGASDLFQQHVAAQRRVIAVPAEHETRVTDGRSRQGPSSSIGKSEP